MSVQETINLAFSFLGGGVVVAILNWFRASRAEVRDRRAAILSDQLGRLYGPLFFFTAQNAELFKVVGKFNKAYSAAYGVEEWSDEEGARSELIKQTSVTIELMKSYIALLKRNNTRIAELLESRFAQVDPEDVEFLLQFLVDYIRLNTEMDDGGKLRTPFLIFDQIGGIPFMRQEFIDRVQSKFLAKKNELARYSRR